MIEAGGIVSDARPREVWAWAMYDFANSGYTTVVITAIFNAYFVSVVAEGAVWGTFAWTATLAVSSALIMIAAPLVGAWADVHAAKKPLLFATTAGCVLFTAALALVGPGDLWLAAILVVASSFFFGSGETLIAAFLPELATGKALGRVSGWGWSLGYFGGLLSLGASLGYITWVQSRGGTSASAVPVTMIITAALFACASVPTFALLRERARPQHGPHRLAAESLGRVLDTLRGARHYRDLRLFLACLVLYQAGIQTVVTLAAVYAEQAMGFRTADTLRLILVVNVMAAAGAFAFGYVQDRVGHVRALAGTLGGWLLAVVLAWAAHGPALFWVASSVVGVCLGSSQSGGRALVAYMTPESRRAEFFGLWGLAVKLSAILGPVTYGAANWISGGDHRLAILTTGIYFVLGLLVLTTIDADRGRRAAAREAM